MSKFKKTLPLLAAVLAIGVSGPVVASAIASHESTPSTVSGDQSKTSESDGQDNDLATQVDDSNKDEGQDGQDEAEGQDGDLATQVDDSNQDENDQGENEGGDSSDASPLQTGATGPSGPHGADGQND